MRSIRIIKYITIATNKGIFRELVPGQLERVYGERRGRLKIKGGWVELPTDTYEWVTEEKVIRFITAWEKSDSVDDVVVSLGWPEAEVLEWQRALRHAGINIKPMTGVN